MKARNKRWSDDEFQQVRQEVLGRWPTGKEVDLDEAIEYHESLPPSMNYALKVAEAKRSGTSLIRTDSGVASIEEHIELLRHLQNEGHADLLGTHVDSLTRTCQFDRAKQALEESLRCGKSLLNGFPIVVHGVTGTRKVTEAVRLPIQLRLNAVDVRLAAEIALASGFTAVSNGSMMSFWHYSKDVPLEVCIRNAQYQWRLCSCYEKGGVTIAIEPSGGFSFVVPFSLTLAANIIDALLAAEQGVKNIIFGVYTMQGNLAQDVSAIKTFPKLGEEYLNRFGYKDVKVAVMGSCWGSIFPEDYAEAFALIALTAVTGFLAKAEIIHFKTVMERQTIPTKEANAASLRAGKKVLDILEGQSIELDKKKVKVEAEMLELETRAIMDRVIELGDGDVAVGAIRGVEAGVLDLPFSTTQYVAGRVMGVRDNEGAVRYLDHGNLPFTKDILEFHLHKIAEREKAQGRKIDYKTVTNDLYAISRGPLVTG
jgi:methylaspartate mutase epsilon subunit